MLMPDEAQAVCGEPLDVLVVGAGVAGLAAAQELLKQGRSVRVVEARERVGGRLYTRRDYGDIPIEIGAELIHGTDAVTWALIHQQRLATVHMSTGQDLTRHADTVVDAVCPHRVAQCPPQQGQSAAAYLSRIGVSRQDIRHGVYAIELDLEPLSRCSALDLAASGVLTDALDPCEEEDYRVIGGYDQILHPLLEGVPLVLETAVHGIAYGKHGVRLSVSSADMGLYTLAAKQCIVTLPLGVLQGDSVHFTPALPADHRQAIEGLGVCDVAKLIYIFDEPVLGKETAYLLDYDATPPYFWNGSLGYEQARQEVVVAWVVGDKARHLLALPEDERFEAGLETLRRMSGKPHLEPVQRILHHWSEDPYARGAYSFIPPGAEEAAQRLSMPVESVLHFAGEATSSDHPASIHGALESGRRAAHAALALLGA